MKKILLTVAALATTLLSANAQRMTLHEEFTGENCPPCASTNPGFWDLCNGGTNPSKLIHISYMVPIPSAGWYCNRQTAMYTWRDSYYSVPFAPYGRYDGHVPNPTASSPGHPGYFTQADIDAEAAVPTSFNMSVVSTWTDATCSAIQSVVTITSTSAWTGTTPYLRTMLVKTDHFASAPGTNGETDFENVVQAVYPSGGAWGTSIPTSWPASTTNTYTITGTVPSYVDKSENPRIVVFIQDDGSATKAIAQAAQSPVLTLPLDAGMTSLPSTFCVTGTSGSVAPSVTLKNTGTTALTSATIYYKIDGGTMMSTPWTGSLAAGATEVVALPASTLSTGGHTLYDSVADPNAAADVNVLNNASSTAFLVQSNTAASLPLTTGFESGIPANWTLFDANGNGKNLATATVTNHATGGSKAIKHDNYNYAAGEENYCILPTPTISGTTTLEFWLAHAQYSSSYSDKLEVVYSTDCGDSWTSIWSQTGSTLATTAATTSAFSPTSASQWAARVVNVTSVPTGALVAFRATSDYGNNVYIDDINMHAGAASTAVAPITSASANAAVYPNPAVNEATLSFTLANTSSVQVQVVDELGRVLNTVANETMNAGAQKVVINTSALATGIYNVVVRTEQGTFTQHLSVVK